LCPPNLSVLAGWDRFVDEYMPRVYRFALRLTGNRQEAEDLTQETFLQAWCRRGDLRDPDAARVWLFTIAKNLWNDWLRRKGRRPAISESLSDDHQSAAVAAEHELIAREDLRRVLDAMDSLPARQREVLYLRACEDLPLGEIAEVLGISPEAAKASLCEARKRLRRQFREIDCGTSCNPAQRDECP
jgi:RNA polymerase sigma-70 factor, ECF subfamily